MKRKTNLFYTTGTDSNFITFSNYTEAMTGNFLATNVKLFPSKFLCLYINIEDREDFIKQLAAYYENKVAFLRDDCISNNTSNEDLLNNTEKKLKLLGYLIDFIKKYDPEFKINYIGQVAEQDYNGIFADTICVIDSSQVNRGEVEYGERGNATKYNESNNYLYGWSYIDSNNIEQYIGPDEYNDVSPVLDDESSYYYYTPETSYINIVYPNDNSDDIEFNCIIPLFDIINVDKNQNTDIIQNFERIDCLSEVSSIIDVPYGIWFANKTVKLTRDNTEYSPSWSLVIGSQFKPFPYSKTPVSDIDQSVKADAFMTFSQILVKQNQLIDKLMEITESISALNARVADVESNLKSTGTSYNIDGLHKEIIDMSTYLQNQINDLK